MQMGSNLGAHRVECVPLRLSPYCRFESGPGPFAAGSVLNIPYMADTVYIISTQQAQGLRWQRPSHLWSRVSRGQTCPAMKFQDVVSS